MSQSFPEKEGPIKAKAYGASMATSRGVTTGGLPPDLLLKAARRLGAICLIYACAFFLAGIFPLLVLDLSPEVTRNFAQLGVGTFSIALSLIVFGISRSRRIPVTTLLNIGLIFEVAGSFGIAFAEYWGILNETVVLATDLEGFGLSWVAVWMIVFTVGVPTRPGRALVAALASGAAVPITFALTMQYGGTLLRLTPSEFFAALILPYLICTGMAYASARIIYRLGTDVRRAREMGSYRLEERIGQGGMGEVWLARHRMLARPAAVKLIRASHLGAQGEDAGLTVLKRFGQEAQATAALRSPHTIVVYDFGLSDDGTFYYVMELLDGMDLDTLVRRYGPQPPERVVHVLRQACHSLHEAHGAGLTHRDIKPANLFICRYGSDLDFVKVLDFGLVSERSRSASDETKLTREGTVVGSPAFMPPEMALAEDPVEGRADLYALGCVAYWLLTGSLVFESDSPMEMIVKHARDTPEPPSARSELDIPEALDHIVMACLEKDPARRPQTARELSDRLAELQLDPLWTEARMSRWWEAHAPQVRSSSSQQSESPGAAPSDRGALLLGPE